MDPLSITASAATLIGVLAVLTTTTANALECAKILTRINQRYDQIANSLQTSIEILYRLNELKSAIAKTGAEQLRSANISHAHLSHHLAATKALSASLQSQRKRLHGIRRIWTVGMIIARSNVANEDLQRNAERFRESMGCLSILLNTLQTFLALSTRELCIQGSAKAAEYHEATLEKLGEISVNQVSSNDKLGQVCETTAQSVVQIARTLSVTNENINEICQSLIDNNINALALSTQNPIKTRESWFGVPYPRNRWFSGREQLLDRIVACLLPAQDNPTAERTGRVFGIHGLPGIGKTHAAIEFTYRRAKSFTHIFWISADSDEKLEQGFVTIARDIGLVSSTAVEDRDKVLRLVLSWLKEPQEGSSWLLVLDNVDNFDVLNQYWSSFSSGAVLITSRETIPWLSALTASSDGACLKPFSPHEGVEMIKKRLGNHGHAGVDDNMAADLAKRFAFYPLYMDQMASFIEADPLPLSEWHKQLDLEFGDQELQEIDPNSPWHSQSVAKAIEAHVTRLDSQHRLVLATIAFFDPDNVPEQLLLSQNGRVESLSSPVKRKRTLQTLARSSFIHLNPGSGGSGDNRCIDLHRLVRDSAIRSCPDLQTAFDNATELLRQAFPLHKPSRDHMVEEWEECEIFQPHVLTLHQRYLEIIENKVLSPSFDFVGLIYSCAWYMCERGRFDVSKGLIASVRAGYDQIMAAKHTGTMPPAFLSDICTVEQFYHNEATSDMSMVDLARKAMDIRELAVEQGLMDPHHPNRANGFMNVGVAMAWDNPRGAIEMHSRALEIRLGSDKYREGQLHGLALNYLNIGRVWYMVHDLTTAAECFEKCLSLMQNREREVGKKFALTAWAISALGIVRAHQNNLEEAIRLLSEGLVLHLETMGDRHMKTLACYYQLAWVCQRLGELEKAEQILRLILHTYTSFDPQPKPEIARIKFKLSEILHQLGVPQPQYYALRQEARLLLAQILGRKTVDDEYEKDYDNCIAYFLR